MQHQWLIVIGIGLAAVIGLGLAAYYRRRRRQQLELLAMEWGFTYDHDGATAGGDNGLAQLDLFQKGRGGKFQSCLRGALEDVKVAIFDYRYTTGSGKNRRTTHQTVAAFEVPSAALPAFTLRREHFFHKIGQLFGYQDIDFPDYPLFSKKYLLRGQDEQAIRGLFSDEAIRYFEQLDAKYVVEGHGPWVIVYTGGKRIKPARLRDFLTRSWEVFLTLPTA